MVSFTISGVFLPSRRFSRDMLDANKKSKITFWNILETKKLYQMLSFRNCSSLFLTLSRAKLELSSQLEPKWILIFKLSSKWTTIAQCNVFLFSRGTHGNSRGGRVDRVTAVCQVPPSDCEFVIGGLLGKWRRRPSFFSQFRVVVICPLWHR